MLQRQLHFPTFKREQLVAAWRTLGATDERRLFFTALLARLIPAFLIYGSQDVPNWETLGRTIMEGGNPWMTKYFVAWPPLWLPLTAIGYLFAETSPLPFYVAIKLFPITADLIVTFVLYFAASRFALPPYRTAMLFAVNPVSIYMSAVHGQFDPIPTMLMTIAVLMAAERDPRGTRRGIALGIAAAFKTWPLFVLPALFAAARKWSVALCISLIACVIFAVAITAPALFLGMEHLRAPLQYRGELGWWGVSSIAVLAGSPPSEVLSRTIFYAAMPLVAIAILLRRPPAELGALLLLLTFYVSTPGFGVQYLVWIVPIALIADQKNATAYSIVAALLLIFEAVARPYSGVIGDTLRVLPEPGFSRAYGSPHDQFITCIARLPVWLFTIYWWLAAARKARRTRT